MRVVTFLIQFSSTALNAYEELVSFGNSQSPNPSSVPQNDFVDTDRAEMEFLASLININHGKLVINLTDKTEEGTHTPSFLRT